MAITSKHGAALATVAGLAATAVVAAPSSAQTTGLRACHPSWNAVSFKVDRAPVLGDTFTDGTFTTTVTDVNVKADGSGEVYGFSMSDPGVSWWTTIIKGGPVSTVTPHRDLTDMNTKLSPGGRHYEISNIIFCYRP